MGDLTRTNDLDTGAYRELEYHISKALDLVGLDHNFTDVILDAFDDAVAIAEEDA